MDAYPRPLKDLISQLRRLPGVGEKTATRLALYILAEPSDLAVNLAQALQKVKQQIRLCPICFNLTDRERCPLCDDGYRDSGLVCVVDDPSDVIALESAHEYRGVYHVLHGLISPLNGIGPDDIKLPQLLERLKGGAIREIIIATNPSVDGEATAHYLNRVIAESCMSVRVSRIASGVPMGGELKYMDQVTLASALRYRRSIK